MPHRIQVILTCCRDRMGRTGSSSLQASSIMLQPKLSEAVSLMEVNFEEPLGAADIAVLAGLSRRQIDV